jgi:hypothetical protein
MYQSRAKQGGVCILTHGAVVKRCNYEGCTRQAQKGGVCVTHGAVVNRCYHEGCTKYAVKGGVCITHGAIKLRKRCSHKGCSKHIVSGGVCITHDAVIKCCSHNKPKRVRVGVCITHGASQVRKRCRHKGCTQFVQKSGLCRKHYRLSLVSAQDQDVEDRNYSMTTGRVGVTASAAPQPALIPRPPSFLVGGGPPESVTVSIIIDKNDDFQLWCHTSVCSLIVIQLSS